MLLNAPRGEQVVIAYQHDRGENTYTATFEGIIPNLERRYRETESEYVKAEIERFMVERPCPTCEGRRLRPEALAVTVDGRTIAEVTAFSVADALWPGRRRCPSGSASASGRSAARSSRRSGPASASSSTSGSTT